MRILIATHSIDWGGSARSLRILVRYLAARHELSIVTLIPPRQDRPMAADYAALGVPSIFLNGAGSLSATRDVPSGTDQDARCEAMSRAFPNSRLWQKKRIFSVQRVSCSQSGRARPGYPQSADCQRSAGTKLSAL